MGTGENQIIIAFFNLIQTADIRYAIAYFAFILGFNKFRNRFLQFVEELVFPNHPAKLKYCETFLSFI